MKRKVIIEKPHNDLIYVRVSSKEQVLGFSLDSQEKVCRDFSKKSGHEVLMVFREEGESAKTADRTELQKMLRFCETNKRQIDRVVVYKVDRFSRDTADYLALRACLNRLGIKLVSATESFDNTPAGKLNETILSAFAQFDNDVRSQRTIEGMKARCLKGYYVAIAPWGYMNTKDNTGTKIIAPHSEKAPVVKMMFQAYATGKYSFKDIAKMVNKSGTKSRNGVKFTKQLVSKIIKNPVYYGRVIVPKWNIDVQGNHEPIVSKELFDEANSGKRSSKSNKLARNRDSPDYPLRGIRCSGCGKSISGGKSRSKTGKYYQYYACFCLECKKRTAIKKKDLEDDFTKFLLKLTPSSKDLDVLAETIKLAHKSELNYVEDEERKFNVKIEGLKEKKNKLLELRIAGEISTEEFGKANEDLKKKISEQEEEMSKLSSPALNVDTMVNNGIEFIKQFPQIWNKLHPSDLRVLRNLFFPENVYYYYPTIKTPKICCIYSIEPSFCDERYCQVTLQRIEL